MAYNTKAIKTDVNAKPIPQLYNPVTDEYEVLQGTGGAARQVLYGPDGQPISTTEGKLAVRAAELEMVIANLQTALLDNQSTAAKQDALAGLVGAIDAAAVSDPAAAGAVIALLKGLLSRLQTLENKIDSFTTGEETVNTELKGSLIEDEQAVPIRYPAMEKRYTEYDNYVLPAGASIDRSIYEDIKGFRYVNLVLWRDDTTIPVRIQLYSRGLLKEWFNNTIEDIGAGQKIVSIIDYPIIPTTWMYVVNKGDTAVTFKGIAIKART
jgi:hypothetical protein